VKRSNRLLILVGVFLAVIGFVGVLLLSGGGGPSSGPAATPTPTPEAVTTVVVAATDINQGDVITAGMVKTVTVSLTQASQLGDTFTLVNQVVNKRAGSSIKANTVLSSSSLQSFGAVIDGTDIAGGIASGDVAVSMEVDQVNGVGTLILPYDHVDIILSVYSGELSFSNVKDSNGNTINVSGVPDPTVKLVIQDKRVLETLLPPAAPEIANTTANSQAAPNASATPVPQASANLVQNTGRHMIVVLEVTPQEAEVIRWLQRAEKQDPQNYISYALALRSDKDNGAAPAVTTGITYKKLVEAWGVLPPDARGILPPDIAKGISW
jgi:Flp pilus assembly protein CpaB